MNRSTEIRLNELKTKRIQLGFVGENLYRQVWFMCDEIYAQFPHAAAALTVKPPKGQSYPAVLERVDNAVVWNITDSDLAYRGRGEIQLSFVVDEMVAKTYIGRFEIERSITPQGEAPSGIDDFLTRAGAALTAIPETIDQALEEAKESGEFDGPPGPAGADGKDGKDGRDGTDGKDGQDGAPGRDGTDGKDGTDGQDGQDGTDAYVWIRYAAAQPTADADMKTSPDAWIGIYSGDAATAPEHYTDYAWYKIKGEPGPVQDVQVNGITVMGQGGVANVPIATEQAPGVMQLDGAYGVAARSAPYSHILRTFPASSNTIKAGIHGYQPIVPSRQHESAFYAFAKAAGVDMASSDNPVGQYTDAAKVAIQKMLGIYEAPWELIREDTITNNEAADVDIAVDGYGESYELTDIAIELIVPAQTSAVIDNYGLVYFYYGSGNQDYITAELGAKTITAGSVVNTANALIKQEKGLYEFSFCKWTTTGNAAYVYRQPTLQTKLPVEVLSNPRIFNKVMIKSITGTVQYKLYGKRKWN